MCKSLTPGQYTVRNNMVGLLSYPRCGNHLVRYIIEWMTGEETLGCASDRRIDSPIHERKGVKLLKHVKSGNPVATKEHSGLCCDWDKLILIIRHPWEAYLSHYGDVHNSWYLNNLITFDEFIGEKTIVVYEDLVFNKDRLEMLQRIGNMFNIPVQIVESFMSQYDKLINDSFGSLIRRPRTDNENSMRLTLSDSEIIYVKERLQKTMDHPIIKEYYGS